MVDRYHAPSAPRAAAWTVAVAVLLMACIGASNSAWADAVVGHKGGDVTNTTLRTRGLRNKESRIIGGANVSWDSRDM